MKLFQIGPGVKELSFMTIVHDDGRTKTDHKTSPCHYVTGELTKSIWGSIYYYCNFVYVKKWLKFCVKKAQNLCKDIEGYFLKISRQ